MAIFGLYFISGLLNEMGWPRKQGLLRRACINTTIFDTCIDTMIDWAASIGAGRPTLALQVIAYMFKDKDWEGSNAPDIKIVIEGSRTIHQERARELGSNAPHVIIQTVRFVKHYGASMKAKVLQDAQLGEVLEHYFLCGLLYGLGNPKRFELWYKDALEECDKKLPLYIEAGLDVHSGMLILSEYYADNEQIIRNYERDMEMQLPSIPPKLLSDAKAVRL